MNLMFFVSANLETASQMAETLRTLQQQQVLHLQDAAISVRQADGSNQMWTCQELVGNGHLGGMFWGVLFALIYWSRLWGLNIGSIVDDYGIDDEFIKNVSLSMTKPLTPMSALALICADEVLDSINDALNAFDTQAFTFVFSGVAQEKLNAIFVSGQ